MSSRNLISIKSSLGQVTSLLLIVTKYLDDFRAALDRAKASVVNIAIDGEHSPYALDRSEREQAIAFSSDGLMPPQRLAHRASALIFLQPKIRSLTSAAQPKA